MWRVQLPGRDVLALGALPGLVSLPAAVEALHVDIPEGSIQHGQLVHVGRAQGHHLAATEQLENSYQHPIYCIITSGAEPVGY